MTIYKHLLSLILCATCLSYPSANAAQLSGPASEAAKLLNVQSEVDRLLDAQSNASALPTDEVVELQLHVIRKVMGSALEVRAMAGRINDGLTAEYTARNELIARRDSGVTLNNSANFIQDGVFSLLGGGLALANYSAQPNELAIVSGGATALLSLLSVWQARGGSKKDKTDPNMLGQIFKKDSPDSERFSPVVWAYLNSVPPDSKDKLTRREHLIASWKKGGVQTVDVSKAKNVDKLTAIGPGHTRRCETIKLINNRIYMLHDVERTLATLDIGLVELLHALD